MADLPMTPDEARVELEIIAHPDDPGRFFGQAIRALETLAAMRVEHDHGVVDWEQVDGRYETHHRVRLVGEWRDA